MEKDDSPRLLFLLSTGFILIGLFSPVFMTVWDLSVAWSLIQYNAGNPDYQYYFLDEYDAQEANRMVEGELSFFIPLIIIGIVLVIANVLLLKFRKNRLTLSLLYSIPYCVLSLPTILVILT